MPLADLIERARQGDAGAIARLITRSLADQGIVARGQWQGAALQIALEGDEVIDPAATVPIIRRGLRRLQLTCPVHQVQVTSRQVGHTTPDWQETFLLDGSDPGDEVIPPTDYPEGQNPQEATTYLSDHALLALAQLSPLFGYLTVATNSLIGFAFFWWGGPFLLPWRIVPPLVVLLVRGQDSPFLRQQSKNALNFQISMMIYWIVTIGLMVILIGFVLVIPLALVEVIASIIAAVKSSEGKPFRYPLAIPFVK